MTDNSSPNANSTRTTTGNPSGNILAFGNGQGNSALTLWWAMWIVSAVACFAIGMFVANDLAQKQGQVVFVQGPSIEQRIAFMRGSAIIVPILCLVYGAFYHFGITNTYIQVDGNGVVGKGAGKGFIWGDPRLFGFRLAFNQVTSVDVAGSTIIIHASGAQYKCYVANPDEIQRVIVEQQQKKT